jgi:DNA-binding response OmpR family regulator
MESKLLVVDDELFVRELLAEYFTNTDYQVRTAGSAAEALRLIETENFNAALIDLRMPETGGMDLLRAIKETADDLSVIVMTGYPTVDTAVNALRAGAFDYIVKPFRLKELDGIVSRAVTAQKRAYEMQQLRERVTELETRMAKLKKRENHEGVEVRPRRFTIIEKTSEGETYEIEQPVLAAAPRHRLRDVTRAEPVYDDTSAVRREFRNQSISLMEESS